MRPESLNLVLAAARINPNAMISVVASENDKYAEALVDVYGDTVSGGAHDWDVDSWDSMLEELDNDPRTIAQFVDSPAVRTLIRKQEAGNAGA